MTKDTPQPPADETVADCGAAATEATAPAVEAIYSPQLTDTASLRAAWRMGLNPNTTAADFERLQRQTLIAPQDSATDSLATASHRGFKPASEPESDPEPQT